MDNRTRKNQLKIYLTDEEKEIFEKKMKLANCKLQIANCKLQIANCKLQIAKQYPILLENVY